jgi:RTX calcium-binding nonapeptide repeat (4 copies)
MAVKIKSDFAVNTSTDGFQLVPQIATLANGRFVIIWQDGLDSQSDIRGQVFKGSGAKLGGEILVNTETDGWQSDPTIAALANGHFVVAWTDRDGLMDNGDLLSGDGVYAQDFSASGSKSGGAFLINQTTAYNQNSPAIAALDGGRFALAWDDDELVARIFNGPDDPATGELPVNLITSSNATTLAYNPVITTLSNGNIVIAWQDNTNLTPDTFRGQVFKGTTGARIGDEFQIADSAPSGYALSPTITALDNGRFVAMWKETAFDIYAQIFNKDGSEFTGEFQVDSTAFQGLAPSAAALSDGRFVAVWQDYGADPHFPNSHVISGQVFNANGSKFGDRFLVNKSVPPNQSIPTVAALDGHRFVVTWGDQIAVDDVDIKAAIFGVGDFLKGNGGDNTLLGTDYDDIIRGRNGDDVLKGFGAGDELFGEKGKDKLLGAAGNDMLKGNAGADQLTGGAGKDTETGGGGADRFIFKALSDSTVKKSGRDTITDFKHGQGDRIDLHFIDAKDGPGNQAFSFIGTQAFHNTKGELRYNVSKGVVLGDTDGDGKADFAILVKGVGSLGEADFVL